MKTKTKTKTKTIAMVSVLDVPRMTVAGRKRIVRWLRSRANVIERHPDLISRGWFRQRYIID